MYVSAFSGVSYHSDSLQENILGATPAAERLLIKICVSVIRHEAVYSSTDFCEVRIGTIVRRIDIRKNDVVPNPDRVT